ncbi:MAG: U3 small nucleolar RNA-associated protein 13, partial [Pleopsidium flavum]
MRVYSLKANPDLGATITPELLRTLKPHTSPVVISAVDDIGTLLATGGTEGVVKIWDIRGGYLTHTFRGHSGVISSLHFFETAVVSREQQRRISAENGRVGRRKSKSQEDEEMNDDNETKVATTTAFRLASADEDGKIRVWDLHKRKPIALLDSHV